MQIDKTDVLFSFDIDNTLLRNWKGWDGAIRATSKNLYGIEFAMLRNPDGTVDRSFSKMTTSELWKERLTQIGLNPNEEDEDAFFRELDAQAAKLTYQGIATRFRGVVTFLNAVKKHSVYKPTLLSTGPRGMQLKTLTDLGLLHHFDIEHSLFYRECASKAHGLAGMVQTISPNALTYVGDAPSDMGALHSTIVKVAKRFAVGVTAAGLSSTADLTGAGAHYIINRYDLPTANLFRLTCS